MSQVSQKDRRARSSGCGWCVVVGLVVLGVSGCGVGGGVSGGSLVPVLGGVLLGRCLRGASGGAGGGAVGASVDASGVGAGVTADSLSDPEAEYTVVSIPEGLDATQSEVLSAFVAYDRASWKAVRDMDGTGEVEATATGQELASFTKGYKDHESKGQHVEGSSRVEVSAVDLLPDGVTASVGVCND